MLWIRGPSFRERSFLQACVVLLQDKECLLLYSLVGEEPLAVEAVLNTGQKACGGAEVHQQPRTEAAQKRHLTKHNKLLAENLCLVLLGKTLGGRSVQAGFAIAAKFADD